MINEVATTHRPLVLRARVAHEKRKEKRQRDLKEPSTAQRQTCLTKFFPQNYGELHLMEEGPIAGGMEEEHMIEGVEDISRNSRSHLAIRSEILL